MPLHIALFLFAAGLYSRASLSCAMAAAFKKCLKATDEFLGQIKKLPCASKVESQRVNVLLEMVSKAEPWAPEAAGEASTLINASLNFSKKSRSSLLERLCGSLDSEPDSLLGSDSPEVSANGRLSLQDYTNMVHFIPDKIWDTLLDGQKPTADCLMVLCDHCQRLGLTNPSEKTYGTITCLAFWGIWQKHEVNLHTKRSTLTIAKPFIKQYLQHYQKQRPVLEAWRLKCLPNTLRRLPSPMQVVFKENNPVEAPAACLSAATSMPCRITNQGASVASMGAAAAMQLEFSKHMSPVPLVDVKERDSTALPCETLAIGDVDTEPEDEQEPKASKSNLEKHLTSAGVPVLEQGQKSLLDLSKKLKAKKIQDPVNKATKRKVADDSLSSLKEKGSKVDVQSTLQNLKAKMAAKKAGAAMDDKDRSAVAVVKDVGAEKKNKTTGSPKKSAKKPPKKKKEKAAASKPKAKPAAKATCEATADKADKVQVLAAKVLDSMSSKAEWPAWTESKEQLLAAFPNDTKKRFNSRCYHRVLDFEVRNGLEKNQAKLRAQHRHREASAMWDQWFST